MIDLAHCTTVKSADLKSKKRHSFEISTPELTYLLYADVEQEKDDWIGRVGKAIVRCSSTYYSNNNNNNNQNNNAPNGARNPYAPNNQTNMYPNNGFQPNNGMGGYNHNTNNPMMMNNPNGMMNQGDDDDDDDDILYEDPNNPNPYFND